MADEDPSRLPESKRVTDGLLALTVGPLGVHKFYLGMPVAGVVTILTCCGLGGFVPAVEGIIYLRMSDEEFVRTYQIGHKSWF